MATIVVVFKILFLVLIAHSFVAIGPLQASASSQNQSKRPSQDNSLAPDARRQQAPATASRREQEIAVLVQEDHEPGAASDGRPNAATQTTRAGSGKSAAPSSSPPPPLSSAASANYAELCYLSNGGSSLTLTVNEATQVGSIIGTVDVNGDPSLDGGNVNLFDALEPQQWSSSANNRSVGDNHSQLGDGSHSSTPPPPPSPGYSKQRRLLGRRAANDDEEQPDLAGAVQLQPPSQHHKLSHRSPARLVGLVSEHQTLAATGSASSGSFYSLVASTASASSFASPPPSHAQQPPAPPVRLEPGTRNLILVRSLDKESVEGEQSLVINVRCNPRSPAPGSRASQTPANDPDSSTIPVRIIVTDANDHAPEFVGAQPYVVNISETTPIGTVVSRDILAQDRDSAGPHSTLHYRVLEDGSPHSALLQFANPLDPTLLVAGQLDYETLASFTLTIVAQDQGEPEPLSASTQVQVNIIDFDDQNPRFLDDKYSLIMDDVQQNLVGQNLQVLPRNLYAEDGDRGIGAPILYSFDQLGGGDRSSTGSGEASGAETAGGSPLADDLALNIERYLHLNPTSGEIRLIRQWPASWPGSPVTLVVRATQADNKDRYTLTTLTITRPPPGGGAVRASQQARARQQQQSHQTDGDGDKSAGGERRSQGIEFTPDRLSINVPENVPINEKIARVRARYSAGESRSDFASGSGQATGENQAVDLVHESSSAAPPLAATGGGKQQSSGGNKTRVRAKDVEQSPQQLSYANIKRPINYQILDDQTDQFGINGLGEIFVKRPLDYELRQEYKFRVLATYTKYSDICQVQVNVQNVNDNKPKFTQPQYTFHVTETRLRSNVIGAVQAHDADLNDTISYSLHGDHAHLFEVSSGGQISLRAGIRQLNISGCHLTVQAHDSLGGPSPPAQARVNLQVAPQLVGRSLSLDNHGDNNNNNQATPPDQHQAAASAETKTFNARSASGDQTGWTTAPGNEGTRRFAFKEDQQSYAKRDQQAANQRSSVATVVSSLQHMVRGSNLLDMPMSSALVLSAVLALLICVLFIILISMSVHLYRRRAKTRHRQHLAAASRLRHAQMAASAANYQSPGARNVERSRYSGGSQSQGQNSDEVGAQLRPTATTTSSSSISSSPTNSTAAGGSPNYHSTSPRHQQLQLTPANCHSNNALSLDTVDGRHSQLRSARLDTLSGRVSEQNDDINRSVATANPRPSSQLDHRVAISASNQSTMSKIHYDSNKPENSLLSSLSSQSKRSYQSNTTDDSSVMHCGHYSVNASCQLSPQTHTTAAPGDAQLQSAGADDENKSRAVGQALRLKTNELSGLTSGRPGIKSYRKLPPLGSLARPLRSLADNQNANVSKERDSAIGSDESANNSAACNQLKQQQQSQRQGLMAMIRDPEQQQRVNFRGGRRPTSSSSQVSSSRAQVAGSSPFDQMASISPQPPPPPTIRWPDGSAPQRVKKLTWDDELVIAPDLPPLGGPISPLGSQHHYPIDRINKSAEGMDDESEHFVEQHFLFSNQCSPVSDNVGQRNSGGNDDYFESGMLPPLVTEAGEQHHSSIMGQNNCFDYTIVQSSQFRPDNQQQQQQQQQQHSLSAQHHLIQQHQHQVAGKWQQPQADRASYLYSNSLSIQQQQPNQQDLKLMTAAAL